MGILQRALLLALLAGALAWPGRAAAEVEIEETTEYYDIEGTTLRQLLAQMIRKGPKSDEDEHAIAVTKSLIKPGYKVRHDGNRCTIWAVKTVIEVTIVYPNWVNDYEAPSQVQYAWESFMQDIVDHEDQHSAFASETAWAIDNDLEFLTETLPCAELEARAKRIIKDHFKEMERLNIQFHEDEARKEWERRTRGRRRR